MPQVPRLDQFQVAPAPGPRAAASFDLPNIAPGMVAGRQAEELGQGLQRAGQGLTGIALAMAEDANRVREADAMNKFIAKRTDLHVKALQLQGRAALERPDGKALPDEFDELLQQEAKTISEGLGNDTQRQRFSLQAAQAAQELRVSLSKHMVEQQRAFKGEERKARIEVATNQGVLVWGDEKLRAQSAGTIAATIDEQAADEGWTDEIKQERLRAAMSPMHAGVIKGMMDAGKPEMARAYYDANSATMSIQARAVASEAIQVSEVRVKAQAFGDEAMGKGMSQADALAEARRRFSGKEEDEAVREVNARYAEREVATVREARELGKAAWAAVMETGKVPADLLASLRAKAPEEERQIRDWQEAKWRRAKADAEGKAKTDMEVYYGFRRMAMEEPERFAQINLLKAQPYLRDEDLKGLINMQVSISRGDAKAMETQRVVKQTLGAIKAEVASIGIDLTPKEGSPQAKETAKFLGTLTQALDEATRTKVEAGKGPLTPDEAKRIGLSMVQEGVQQGSGIFGGVYGFGWSQAKKRGYQIASDPDASGSFVLKRFDDIPPSVRNALVAEYRTKHSITARSLDSAQEAEIERAYTRGVQTGRIK